jgi:hypothetical protein
MFGLAWLSPTIMAIIGVVLVSGTLSGVVTHKFDAAAYMRLESDKAKLETEYSNYRAHIDRDTAIANAKAIKEREDSKAKLDALQDQLDENKRKDDAKSAALQKLLASAKPGDIRALGPSASEYYRRLQGP